MNTSRHYTPAQLNEGRRNAAAALLHYRRGDRDAAFQTLVSAESFAASVMGLLNITATVLGPDDIVTELLENIALTGEAARSQFKQREQEEGTNDD